MEDIAIGSMRVKRQKINLVVLLSLGLLFFLPAFWGYDSARADFIDQVNNASDGDTVIITSPYLKPYLLWEPTEKLRSEKLDINRSITLEGDVKRRIECVQLNVKANDVTINRFEFSHKQDYLSAVKDGQIDRRAREDRFD